MFHAFRQAARQAVSKANDATSAYISNSSTLAVALILVALASEKCNENDKDTELNIQQYVKPATSISSKSLLPPTILTPLTCQCELSTKMSHLRRCATSKLMANVATNKTFFSLYEVDFNNPLGQGAYGDVYMCREISTGEECALKKIPKVCW